VVKGLKPNGRLEVVPIGTWSPRFAEGARVTIFSDAGAYRGTILPLKASGHAYDREVDTQPVAWSNLEVRVDEVCRVMDDLVRCGFRVGDFIAVDAAPEVAGEFINARHLDDKAGVAVLLGAARAVLQEGADLLVDCHLLFTITEEVGSGASVGLHGDIAEMVTVDNAVVAPNQNSVEQGVTIAMQDMSGPFDYHLTHHLLDLCRGHQLVHARDVFLNYRSDSASAVEAGNDIRTALVCFGLDASHGYERVHRDSLETLAQLLTLYMRSGLATAREPTGHSV
jgi:peptidase M42 family hydrolase